MIVKNNIWQNRVTLSPSIRAGLTLFLLLFYYLQLNAQSIVVNAGADKVICNSDTLYLSSLNAQISGLVNDGYWFTTGDGIFIPSYDDNVQFSLGTAYLPGPLDIQNGGFDLLLVSLDPDGFGPLVQVTDMVRITLMGNIAMVCSSNLNIALGPNCTQQVDPTMLVANLIQPYEFYFVKIKDIFGNVIPNNILTSEHIGQVLEYSVGHDCGTNTCWGYLKVEDKLPPPLFCTNKTVLCGAYTQADSLGLPVSAQAKAKKTGPRSYRVTQLDACGPATLSYNDVYQPLLCETGLQGKITRTWNAVDSFGNASSCFQVISIKNRSLEQVALPFDFDDLEKPAFECGGLWPKNALGYPSPDTTGMPGVTGCTNLAATYTDTKIEACGLSYKIIRKWTLINWCGTIITEYNQLIKVKDSLAPISECPVDTTIYASPYDCSSLLFRLPQPAILWECSAWSFQVGLKEAFTSLDASQFIVDGTTGNPAVNHLPLGEYIVSYYISDACGNADTCFYQLSVIDNSVPTAICDQFTKVSLDASGNGRLFATTLDDGSIDNCAVVEFKIAKMADNCGVFSNVFRDYADFCCKESGSSVMVALRVTDFSGNANTCMVEVQVQDKLPPVISCPPHLTISCKTVLDTSNLSFLGNVVASPSQVKPIILFDEYNNGVVGYDGVYRDNCIATVTSRVNDFTQCYQGLLQRVFTVTDKFGNSGACTQNILLSNPDPFDFGDITFPANKESNGCSSANAHPSQTGFPSFNNTKCANVAATYEDQIFTFTDGACVKIIRTWTVIDWCQFNANTGIGKWTGLQILKFNNTIDPHFVEPCRDSVLCNYSETCGTAVYDYTPSTGDDCTPDTLLSFSWKIDFNNDGTIEASGLTKNIKHALSNGKHKVSYTVTDGCGNYKTCEYFVTVQDCKKPTPHCLSSLSTVIMPSSGQLTIKAESFDFNSFDNCTPPSQLKFSFSESLKDSLKTITCSDIPNGIADTLDFHVWVFDMGGNKEYCSVHLAIADNGDACADVVNTTSVSGLIWQSGTGDPVKKVKVSVSNSDSGVSYDATTDGNGAYIIDSVMTGEIYKVKPSKNDSIKEGLSTLDVILIQRHILGATRFTDPLQIIAADMDGNKKISVSDLVVLRKIILGSSTSLPGNRDCYTFVDDSYIFPNPASPFNYPDYIVTPQLGKEEVSGLDFTAIKMGDVNNSLRLSGNLASNRTQTNILGAIHREDVTEVFVTESTILAGFQLSVGLIENSEDLWINPALENDVDWYLENNELKIIYTPAGSARLDSGEVVFRINSVILPNHPSVSWTNEWYDENLNIYSLKVIPIERNQEEAHQITLFTNGKNLSIYNEGKETISNVSIRLFDVSGKWVYIKNNQSINPGHNTFGFEELPSNQLYFIEVDSPLERVVHTWFCP